MPGSPATGRARDFRLDFFRGLALLFIFVDHIPDNFLSHFTAHSISFSNAAEVFIFISGYTAALVYGRVLDRRGFILAAAQIYRRVWQLYVAHVFLFVIFVAEVSYTSMRLHNPMYSDEMQLSEFLQLPHVAIAQALILRFQPTFLDILPLYIVLLAGFPLILLLIAHSRVAALATAIMVYAAVQLFGVEVAGFPEGHSWFFNPLAWQLLFTIGAICGYSSVEGHLVLGAGRWLTIVAWLFVGACGLISVSWQLHSISASIPALFGGQLWPLVSDKTDLAPLRLANFLALMVVVVQCVHHDSAFLKGKIAHLFILCGQHSPQIFCLGILLSVTGHFVLSELHGGIPTQITINIIGVAAMLGTALLLEWYKNAEKEPPQLPAEEPVPPLRRAA
jgi:hypothetical protein